jgi:hypothetical protein
MTLERRQHFRWQAALIVTAVLLAVLALAAGDVLAQGEDGAGLIVSGRATAQDVGLPIYPGARPHKDTSDESDAARLGLWGGGFGFKLAVLKMDSNDAPAHVAAFYQKALAKYGKVLDCTNGDMSDEGGDHSRVLTCGDDKPDKGGMLFKAGTKQKQHIVAVEPYGPGTTFALVYLWAKGN